MYNILTAREGNLTTQRQKRGKEDATTNTHYYRNAIANWDEFSDMYKDKYGSRPYYSDYKEQAEIEAMRENPDYNEIWRDFDGNPVRVRFVNGEAVLAD